MLRRPVATVAAANGSAPAGGFALAILAELCDPRLAADRRFGLLSCQAMGLASNRRHAG